METGCCQQLFTTDFLEQHPLIWLFFAPKSTLFLISINLENAAKSKITASKITVIEADGGNSTTWFINWY